MFARQQLPFEPNDAGIGRIRKQIYQPNPAQGLAKVTSAFLFPSFARICPADNPFAAR